MKWLKYQHKFSSGRGAWEWQPVDDDTDEESARDIVAELAEEYNHSEKYGGIDYAVLDKAPRWVIEAKINEVGNRITAADKMLKEYLYLIPGAPDCVQCAQATPATIEHYKQYGHGAVIKPCPLCGRAVLADTVPFWLMPDDKDAVKLLGSLVEQGRRSVKSKKFRWPVEDEDEDAAYVRLSKRGLVGGSSYQDVHEIFATDRGIAEWAKHKVSP